MEDSSGGFAADIHAKIQEMKRAHGLETNSGSKNNASGLFSSKAGYFESSGMPGFCEPEVEVHGEEPVRVSVMHGEGSKSFASAVANGNPTDKVNFRVLINNENVDGTDVVIPLNTVKNVSTKFENTLYGYFIGKRLAYPIVEQFVKNAWKKFGFVRSMMNGKGFFFFQFDSKVGMDRVLEEGPWLIRNVPIILNVWTPSVSLNKQGVKVVPVWVKLHDVPLVAFSEDGLSLLATKLGKPKRLDGYTSAMCRDLWGRSSFARAMIEISSDSELKEEIVVAIPGVDGEGFTKEVIKVEYEWKPPRCGTCCIFGHSDSNCAKNVMNKPKVDEGNGFVEVKSKNKNHGKGPSKGSGAQGFKVNPSIIYKPVDNPMELPVYRKREQKRQQQLKNRKGPQWQPKRDSSSAPSTANRFGPLEAEDTDDDGVENVYTEKRNDPISEGASTPGLDGLNG